ncbi:hypothetical protein BHM03_00048785 [Ensete ventricosum]|uniref:Uncharacterized protein n=1 Tax=Ensete ventricosum TaxID=4639 RepID=A0A426ZPG0_ENSVE|nr:hypothetical protein B296_00040698 [Ensete ventricosum]RZS16748.1 hypothetical protein BHM03_00048785 [Ensete ventricosum]
MNSLLISYQSGVFLYTGTQSFTTQAGHIGDVDWKEEIYQKLSFVMKYYFSLLCGQIKSMKELYFAELSELYQKIAMKFQQVLQLLVSASTFF